MIYGSYVIMCVLHKIYEILFKYHKNILELF